MHSHSTISLKMWHKLKNVNKLNGKHLKQFEIKEKLIIQFNLWQH